MKNEEKLADKILISATFTDHDVVYDLCIFLLKKTCFYVWK